MNLKRDVVLKYSQIFFYLAFIVLWFKDNFLLLQRVRISFWAALIPLAVLSLWRGFGKISGKAKKFRLKLSSSFWILAVLLLLALLFRIPFYSHYLGLFDADDALAPLMGKHISEGKTPPVYFYGFAYEGTLPSHVYSLFYKIFGYSIPISMAIAFLFYSGFVIVQFFIFKEVFSSRSLALALCSFYSLPIGYLPGLSFHLTYPPIILFLGSLSFYLSFIVMRKKADHLVPYIGFFLGLAIWTHPVAVYFGICSCVLLVIRFRLALTKYIQLAAYGIMGCFPIILYDVLRRFEMLSYVFGGGGHQKVHTGKFPSILKNVSYLLTWNEKRLNILFAVLICAGITGMIIHCLKKKKILPESIFLLLSAVVFAIYGLSRFEADSLLIRYIYPLYVVLPVLLTYVFFWFPSRIKLPLIVSLFLFIGFFGNRAGYMKGVDQVEQAHEQLGTILDKMDRTGRKYWVGGYWQSFLLAALSGEKYVCWSYPHVMYMPYKLDYFNKGLNNNFVFIRVPGSFAVKYKEDVGHISENLSRVFDQSRHLSTLLDTLGAEGRRIDIENFGLLLYDLPGRVYPWEANGPVPENVPRIELENVESEEGFLFLNFRNSKISEHSDFRLHIELKDGISLVRGFPSSRERFRFRIPRPPASSFTVKYFLDYRGISILESQKIFRCDFSPDSVLKRRQKIVFFSGFGPIINFNGSKKRICNREARFEVNHPSSNGLALRLYLDSPFNFSKIFWYGKYKQHLSLDCNGTSVAEMDLEDGGNVLDFFCPAQVLNEDTNLFTLRFSYHFPFDFANLWMTSALLERVEVR
ncbi:MAG: hypothetical protein JXB26_17630 [Candidatus Aminicenantes bacterium]|nr:hypothetical protein [Candidatus Aminicenantes bacterium]